MKESSRNIYCAGPLFNDAEKNEMKEIATVLKDHGFTVFLPHEDGLELAAYSQWINRGGKTLSNDIDKGIFALDVYLVAEWCDGIVVNLNGRVSDEGALVEAAIAWSRAKAIVIYKNDSRILLPSGENPLVSGLSKFEIVRRIDQIPNAIEHALQQKNIDRQDQMNIGKVIFDFVSEDTPQTERFAELEILLERLFGSGA
mgnify:CR=1 FL=1